MANNMTFSQNVGQKIIQIPDGFVDLRSFAVKAAAAAATYKSKVLGYNPIAYWMMAEAAGGTSIDEIDSPNQDGAYTGVTLGQAGIGDGNTSPLFDGANDFNNIYTATFNGVFDGSEGSIIIWAKVSSSGVWTDSTYRQFFNIYVDSRNDVSMQKTDANNALRCIYEANNIKELITYTPISDTSWFCMGMTWSATADEVKLYYNGAQVSITYTGLGTFSGNLNSTGTTIGAQSTAANTVWDGWLAHCAVFDSVLTQPDLADLAVVP